MNVNYLGSLFVVLLGVWGVYGSYAYSSEELKQNPDLTELNFESLSLFEHDPTFPLQDSIIDLKANLRDFIHSFLPQSNFDYLDLKLSWQTSAVESPLFKFKAFPVDNGSRYRIEISAQPKFPQDGMAVLEFLLYVLELDQDSRKGPHRERANIERAILSNLSPESLQFRNRQFQKSALEAYTENVQILSGFEGIEPSTLMEAVEMKFLQKIRSEFFRSKNKLNQAVHNERQKYWKNQRDNNLIDWGLLRESIQSGDLTMVVALLEKTLEGQIEFSQRLFLMNLVEAYKNPAPVEKRILLFRGTDQENPTDISKIVRNAPGNVRANLTNGLQINIFSQMRRHSGSSLDSILVSGTSSLSVATSFFRRNIGVRIYLVDPRTVLMNPYNPTESEILVPFALLERDLLGTFKFSEDTPKFERPSGDSYFDKGKVFNEWAMGQLMQMLQTSFTHSISAKILSNQSRWTSGLFADLGNQTGKIHISRSFEQIRRVLSPAVTMRRSISRCESIFMR